MVSLFFGTCTDVGHVREINEDSLLAAPPIFAVADGMGGHDGGDVASQIVVAELGQLGDASYDGVAGTAAIGDSLRECQRKVRDIGETGGRADRSPGTTVAAAMLVDHEGVPTWLLANLGDSRVYKVAGESLDQVSVDHSVVQELIDAGRLTREAAAVHPERHVITRAVGGAVEAEADYFLLPVTAAPRLMLCTDGVSGMVEERALERLLVETPDPRDAADAVVRAALSAGGRDNATAIVVDVVGLTDEQSSYDAEQVRGSLVQKLGALP